MSLGNARRVLALVGLFIVTPARLAAGDEVPIYNTGSGPNIYISWNGLGDPEINADFTVSFTDSANPSIALKTGDVTWNVRSELESAPDNIGTISIDPTTPTADFDLTINNGVESPGADNVGSIILTAGSWTGHSHISGGAITGSLTGTLSVVKDSGNAGGDIDGLTIQGDLEGSVSAEKITSLTIEGATDGTITAETVVNLTLESDLTGCLTLGEVVGEGLVLIEGEVASGAEIEIDDLETDDSGGYLTVVDGIAGQVTIGTMHIDSQITSNGPLSGALVVSELVERGNIFQAGELTDTGSITIADFNGHSHVYVGDDESPVNGAITFLGGLPDESHVQMHGEFNGTIDLNGGDLENLLGLNLGGSGDVINGGTIKPPDGRFSIGQSSDPPTFSGTATFSAIENSGEAGGSIHVTGELTGTLSVTGAMSGLVNVVGTIGEDGSIDIGGAVASTGVISLDDMAGEPGHLANVSVDGAFAGTMTVETVGAAAEIHLDDLSGDLTVTAAIAGGRVFVTGDITSAATITVNAMNSGGPSDNSRLELAGDLTEPRPSGSGHHSFATAL